MTVKKFKSPSRKVVSFDEMNKFSATLCSDGGAFSFHNANFPFKLTVSHWGLHTMSLHLNSFDMLNLYCCRAKGL